MIKRIFNYLHWALINPVDFIRDVIQAFTQILFPYVFEEDDNSDEWL